MTWTAPEVERGHPKSLTGNEREMLESWLEWHRTTILKKCEGLTAAQLAEQSVPPSNISLLGLLRHLTSVEQGWFLEKVGGQQVDRIRDDTDFDAADSVNAEADYAKYLAVLESARQVAAGADLDDMFLMPRWELDLSVRWVFVHMIEEYARHNGHADFLRERIDGVTGH